MEPPPPHKGDADTIWESFVNMCDRMDEHFRLREKVYSTREYAYEHPIVSLFIMVAIGMCSIPIVGFVCFVVSTVLLTFLGFMFFEGSILLFGSLILGGILCFTGMLSLAFSSCLVLSWFLFNASFGFLNGFRGKVETYYQKYTPECLNGVQWPYKNNKEE